MLVARAFKPWSAVRSARRGDVLSASMDFFMGVIHRWDEIQAGWILRTQEPCLIWLHVCISAS